MKPAATQPTSTPPPAPPPPAFDATKAVAVTPCRHDATARTVGYVQGNDLFSATRDFIATATPAEAEAFTAKAKPETPAASA